MPRHARIRKHGPESDEVRPFATIQKQPTRNDRRRGRGLQSNGDHRFTRAKSPTLATPNTSGPSQAAKSGGMFSFFPSASVNWASAR